MAFAVDAQGKTECSGQKIGNLLVDKKLPVGFNANMLTDGFSDTDCTQAICGKNGLNITNTPLHDVKLYSSLDFSFVKQIPILSPLWCNYCGLMYLVGCEPVELWTVVQLGHESFASTLSRKTLRGQGHYPVQAENFSDIPVSARSGLSSPKQTCGSLRVKISSSSALGTSVSRQHETTYQGQLCYSK